MIISLLAKSQFNLRVHFSNMSLAQTVVFVCFIVVRKLNQGKQIIVVFFFMSSFISICEWINMLWMFWLRWSFRYQYC